MSNSLEYDRIFDLFAFKPFKFKKKNCYPTGFNKF